MQAALEPVSRETVRISVLPAEGASASATTSIPLDGSLVKPSWSKPAARITTLSAGEERVRVGDLNVSVSFSGSAGGGADGGAAAAVSISSCAIG